MVISFIDSKGKAVELKPGDEFVSTNRLGARYRYQYLGIMPDECGRDYYLRDLDDGTFSNVEMEWFRQCRIEKNKPPPLDADFFLPLKYAILNLRIKFSKIRIFMLTTIRKSIIISMSTKARDLENRRYGHVLHREEYAAGLEQGQRDFPH